MENEEASGRSASDRLLDLAEVAGVLGVCKRTVQRLVAAGVLPQPVRVGHGVRLFASDVDAYLAGLRQQYRRA